MALADRGVHLYQQIPEVIVFQWNNDDTDDDTVRQTSDIDAKVRQFHRPLIFEGKRVLTCVFYSLNDSFLTYYKLLYIFVRKCVFNVL